ncbi:MAG: hypothetical protein ACYCUM_13640 [Solirubrobacteraceae bacterium]
MEITIAPPAAPEMRLDAALESVQRRAVELRKSDSTLSMSKAMERALREHVAAYRRVRP